MSQASAEQRTDALVEIPHGHSVTRAGGAALLAATRPKQWPKNLLVLAAPATAGVLSHAAVALRTLATLGIFIAASASTYLVNDTFDAAADRLHPTKRLRPVASGELSPNVAIAAAIVLALASCVGAGLLTWQLLVIIASYLLISYAYSAGLKKLAVIELGAVTLGFVLRASAGGAANHLAISPWFLIVTSAAALLVVAGKRSAEMSLLGDASADHRVTLGAYPAQFLLASRIIASAVCVTAYCLWVFERAAHLTVGSHFHNLVWFELSIVPFVLGVLLVEYAIEMGRGGEPEELLAHDRALQTLGLCWLALIGLGIYA